jgi:peptidoglycan hydrolase CwlO-like protein
MSETKTKDLRITALFITVDIENYILNDQKKKKQNISNSEAIFLFCSAVLF